MSDPNPEGCKQVWTHDMRYIGQGYWRCADCGWEPPEIDKVDHSHRIDP